MAGCRISLIDPGRTRTRMRAKAFPGEDPTTLKAPEKITGGFVELAEASCTRHSATVIA